MNQLFSVWYHFKVNIWSVGLFVMSFTYWSHTEAHWSRTDTDRCSLRCTQPPYRFLHYNTEMWSSLEEADRKSVIHLPAFRSRNDFVLMKNVSMIDWTWLVGLGSYLSHWSLGETVCKCLCVWFIISQSINHLQSFIIWGHVKGFFLVRNWFHTITSHLLFQHSEASV